MLNVTQYNQRYIALRMKIAYLEAIVASCVTFRARLFQSLLKFAMNARAVLLELRYNAYGSASFKAVRIRAESALRGANLVGWHPVLPRMVQTRAEL